MIRGSAIRVSEEQTEESAGDKSVWEYVDEILAEGEPSEEELRRQWEEFYQSFPPDPEAKRWARELMERLAADLEDGDVAG